MDRLSFPEHGDQRFLHHVLPIRKNCVLNCVIDGQGYLGMTQARSRVCNLSDRQAGTLEPTELIDEKVIYLLAHG